jgi:hypothetical protein
MRRLSRTFTITVSTLLLAGGASAAGLVAATAASASDTAASAASAANAAGFIYGSDSSPVPITGTAPWPMTHLSGSYGGYIGMIGAWTRQQHCSTGTFLDSKGNSTTWAPANGAQANDNFIHHNIGIGTGVYWYMGGPGVDPHWNGTTAEAATWGAAQAALTLTAMTKVHVTYPVIWADIELPGIKPALDNGWNNVYTSPCSGVVRQQHILATIDRAELNGYASYITAHSKYKVGVYSEPGVWASIFGTGSASLLPNTYEWTYEPETANLSAKPSGWCLSGGNGPCARFFGGQASASKYALMWQWSGGGGVRNPYGDYDQIDVARTP